LLNAEIIKQGYGHAYTQFPFSHMEEFRQLEREAREERRGLGSVISAGQLAINSSKRASMRYKLSASYSSPAFGMPKCDADDFATEGWILARAAKT